MCLGMRTNRELIGNLIILLANRCKPLYHTKLLKLLFLIDQESTKRIGTPLTWLSYNAWRLGPVAEDVFYSKGEGQNRFVEFVEFVKTGENKCIVRPRADFDDSEFSEIELEIIEDVIKNYGKRTSKELVNLTHAKDSLWSKIIEKHNIKFSDEKQVSSEPIDFLELIKDDGLKKTVYYASLEGLEFASTL